MQQLTKIFNGTALPIEMINDTEFMIDVSGVISAFNKNNSSYKRFSRWSSSVSDYIKIVRNGTDLKQTELIVESGNTKKIHNKLLMNFARYISDEFSVWCDNQIYDIILGLKDDQIEKLTNTKHVCNIYEKDNGTFTSCRGLTQHTDIEYDEASIKQNFFARGHIEPYYKRTKHWRLTEKGKETGLFDLDNSNTILYNIDKTKEALNTILVASKNRNHTMKPVHVYNGFTGEYHCTFDSHRQAEKELNCSRIVKVLKGELHHERGMVFKEGEPFDRIEPLKPTLLKKVFRDVDVFKDGIFIERCSTLTKAGLVGGNGQTQVRRLLTSGKRNNTGYTYAYAELDFMGGKVGI